MTQLAEKNLVGHFTQSAKLPGASDLPWLEDLRSAGVNRFEAVGFPSTHLEEWRFTNVTPIARTRFKHAARREQAGAAELLARYSFGPEAASELVFINGHWAPQLSRLGNLPAGVRVASLAGALSSAEVGLIQQYIGRYADIEKNPFVALNTGHIHDGAFIHIGRGEVAGPIHLLFISTSDEAIVSHPRVLIVAEETSQATIVESYVGSAGVYFTNAVTEVIAADSAHVDHCKLQQESPLAFHVATMQVDLGRTATFVSHSASLGSKLTRNDLNVILTGRGGEATLNGLVILDGERHVDNHTLLDHAKPNCPSHELYKHVLSDKSSGVFKGKILVRPDSQRTDSKQTSKTLLLSDDAEMNSQPALEIYADDVKCTHGSTTGPVDEDMVFYLRSRGIALEAARHLLSYAFAADITRRIRVEPVRRRLEEYMAAQHGLPSDLRITDLGRYDEAHR